METVVLKPLQHRGRQCIGIYFPQNATLQHYIQKQAGARWSRTHRCWYAPYTQQNYGQLARVLSGKAILETDALKAFVIEKKISNPLAPKSIQHQEVASAAAKKTPVIQSKPAPPSNLKHQLSEENAEALQKFNQQLVLKGYSPSTIRTYTNEFMQFLNTIKNLPAYEFSTVRIKDYLQYCHTTLKLSENTLHSRMNSLKFYYEQVLKRE
ncbi:MAG TPA: phage integrase N-terminal SAM-like domain-containing protein, partial [Hanamia sp.]